MHEVLPRASTLHMAETSNKMPTRECSLISNAGGSHTYPSTGHQLSSVCAPPSPFQRATLENRLVIYKRLCNATSINTARSNRKHREDAAQWVGGRQKSIVHYLLCRRAKLMPVHIHVSQTCVRGTAGGSLRKLGAPRCNPHTPKHEPQ